MRPQAEKVYLNRFGWEHASPIKAKASASRSEMTCHGLAQAGSREKLLDLVNSQLIQTKEAIIEL